MNVFVTPCLFSVIDHLYSLFHLKNRKVNAGGEEKALLEAEQSVKGSRNQEVADYQKTLCLT